MGKKPNKLKTLSIPIFNPIYFALSFPFLLNRKSSNCSVQKLFLSFLLFLPNTTLCLNRAINLLRIIKSLARLWLQNFAEQNLTRSPVSLAPLTPFSQNSSLIVCALVKKKPPPKKKKKKKKKK